MKLTLVNESTRITDDVLRVLIEDLAVRVGGIRNTFAVRAVDGTRNIGHAACPPDDRPRWAGRASSWVYVNVLEDKHISPGHHVCWHSTEARRRYNGIRAILHVANPGKDGVWVFHEAEKIWQDVLMKLTLGGETHLGRWPIYFVLDAQQAFVHLLAHELRHVVQYENQRSRSEVDCEVTSARVLREWLALQGLAKD